MGQRRASKSAAVINTNVGSNQFLRKVRLLIILLTILTLVSCDNEAKEKQLFDTLYKEKFKTSDNTTVEFIDSTICIILTRTDTIDGITKGTWRIESNLIGTFLLNNVTVDSFKIKLKEINGHSIKFNNNDKDIEFKKLEKSQTNPDISGTWKCAECDSIPPFKNSDKWRHPIYTFDSTGDFEIEEENFRQKGTWKFSPSGQLILLNKLYKSGDFVEGDLLIFHQVTDDNLTISRKIQFGGIVTRVLKRVKN